MASGAESRTLSIMVLLLLVACAVSVIPFVLVSSGFLSKTHEAPVSNKPLEIAPIDTDTLETPVGPEVDAAEVEPEESTPVDDEATPPGASEQPQHSFVDDAAPQARRIPVENITLLIMAVFLLVMFWLRVDPNRWLIVVVAGIFGCLFSSGMYRAEEVQAMPFRLFAWEDILAAAAVAGAIFIYKKRPEYDGKVIEVPLLWVIVGAVFLSFGWKMALGYPWPVALSHLMGDIAVVFVPTGLLVAFVLMLMLMIAALSGNLK